MNKKLSEIPAKLEITLVNGDRIIMYWGWEKIIISDKNSKFFFSDENFNFDTSLVKEVIIVNCLEEGDEDENA